MGFRVCSRGLFRTCHLSFAPDKCNCRDLVPRLRQPSLDGILLDIFTKIQKAFLIADRTLR